MEPTLLRAYVHAAPPPEIRPAPPRRDWMDHTPNGHAYRCLPLDIANTHGWELLCPASFRAAWDGGDGAEAVQVESDADPAFLPVSHFGSGILTFDIQVVFRTSPRWNLWVTGPVNAPRDGIAPLTAVIETDWLPYAFTMNWRFTRPGHSVAFERGEPFCHLFPLPRGYLAEVTPELLRLEDAPELRREVDAWAESRRGFAGRTGEGSFPKSGTRWQGRYYRGLDSRGEPAVEDHTTRLRLRGFEPSP